MRRFKLWLCLLLPASVFGLLMPAAAPAATDMYLKIEGVPGESRDKAHAGEIDVLAWSWGMSNPGAGATRSSGAAGGKANFQDLSLTKYIDRSTPTLMSRIADGQRFGYAKLTVRKAGETPIEYFVMCMTNVAVTSLSTGGSGGEDRLTENISLGFDSVATTYTETGKDGRPGQSFDFGWDLVKNLHLGSNSSACGARGA